jgi:hypothetical protein
MSMIYAQTLLRLSRGKPLHTFPDHALVFCFDAFSSREPVSTRLRWGFAGLPAHSAAEALAKAASLENALKGSGAR